MVPVARKLWSRRLSQITLIGNYPPRRCGIATFTSDLRHALSEALPRLRSSVVALTDRRGGYGYPAEVGYEIRQNVRDDYLAAADYINATDPDVISLQHEYGIFGGDSGDYLLPLLARLRAPVITTLHTVLTEPTRAQRRVFDALADLSATLVVMAERGRDILTGQFNVPLEKIRVIPHGIPDMPFLDPAFAKEKVGLEGRKVILTFGLLSRNKSIETMIAALPAITRAHPDVTYVVLGATHPHQIAHEGESYRHELEQLAKRLGVEGHVKFVNEFVDHDALLDYLTATDIYVTPYAGAQQITSGTLAYSAGLGKAVVSTPYWHASELLADGRGILVPFADSEGFAKAVAGLIGDEESRHAIRRRAYAQGRTMIWPAVAFDYLNLFAEARGGGLPRVVKGPRTLEARPAMPKPSLSAVARLTDGCGILQHSIFTVPDRAHGYCLDDNARALMLMHRMKALNVMDSRIDTFLPVYASFVASAWNEEAGRFRNFMSFDRRWLEAQGSDDSFGRALWALGTTIAHAADGSLRTWATRLAGCAMAHIAPITSPRSWAFMILGLSDYLKIYPGQRQAHDCVVQLSDRLHRRFKDAASGRWQWFETALAYDNARLPEALLRAGQLRGESEFINDGLSSLRWLMRMQTAPLGHFRPAGTDGYGRELADPLPFDQQPVEAWASLDACRMAYDVTGDPHWIAEARRCFAWFTGANDLGVRMAAPGGGCYDGLQVDRVNLNQGAESVLAGQFAICAELELADAEAAPALQSAAAG